MIVTAWNNGSHHTDGNGYGLKIYARDRDAFFRREWEVIFLELEGEASPIEINIDKDSFWNETCRELISAEVGRWLISRGLAPWPKGRPPRFTLEPLGGNRFLLRRM